MTIEERITMLENKQREQDSKIKQLEESIKLTSMGFPVNFFNL